MPQQTLQAFVTELEKAGMLVRIKEEKRVDELPGIMEKYPLNAVLVEKIKDCEFQFLANAYSNHEQYAWAMQCDKTQTGFKIADAANGAAVDLGQPPKNLTILSEKELTAKMTDFIKAKPRSWREILVEYHGQPYPVIYRAFGNLRHLLGRMNDAPWYR